MIQLVLYCLQSWLFRELACHIISVFMLVKLSELNAVYKSVVFGLIPPPFGLDGHLCELIIAIQTWVYVDDLLRQQSPVISMCFRLITANTLLT